MENNKRILRIFPRKTRATPIDENVIIAKPPGFFDFADEIHISVTFSWDLKFSEILYNQWKHVAPCKIGGPALNMKGDLFTPGLYLKNGYVITSRGCHNKCWFCSVPKRDGSLREINISSGNNLLDDNILACSQPHINKVFSMLSQQKKEILLTGGLEAKLITEAVAIRLKKLNPQRIYFSYDTPDDLKPLINISEIFKDINFTNCHHRFSCYVLIGYKGDSQESALKRLVSVYKLGFLPMSMLYRDVNGYFDKSWIHFNTTFANPRICSFILKNLSKK
jgi:hypothetical protein